jgi:hypothetical protein
MSTRNGLGVAFSKSKRDTWTEPEGNCMMRERAGSEPPSESHDMAAGVRSDLKMLVPLGRHTRMASKRSSAAIFARYARRRASLPNSTRSVIGPSMECITSCARNSTSERNHSASRRWMYGNPKNATTHEASATGRTNRNMTWLNIVCSYVLEIPCLV